MRSAAKTGRRPHVEALARQFDRQVREVAAAVGQVGDLRLFLMSSLMISDELLDIKARLAQAQSELARLQSDQARAEARAAQALDMAAQRIEALAARVA